jgi:hypothetical protein
MGANDHRRPAGRLDTRGPGRHARRVTGPDWTRLAAYVTSGRIDAGYGTVLAFAAATGINSKTHYRLEQGKSVGRDTLAIVEKHLGWAPGSAAAVLRGEEPRPMQAATDDAARARAEVIAMTAEELAEMKLRIRAVQGPERAEEWLQKAMELRRSAAPQGSSSPQTTRREVG